LLKLSHPKCTVTLGKLLKERRKALGLTQRSLAQKLGLRTSSVAVLENGRRMPSLGLIGRLATTLGVDGKELLLLARPEAELLLSPIPPRPRNQSWQRILNNPALLARYRVTRRERQALQQMAELGGTLTGRELVAILMLIRDVP
jgi:transcriptional regulator with XRE-family HTH domain